MNKNVVIGLLVLFAAAVVVTATIKLALVWWVFWAALIVAWICLVYAVRKRKTRIFHPDMDLELAEKRYTWLKRFLWAGGISLALFVIGAILHNVLYAWLEREEAISFTVAVLGGLVLFIANIGSLVIFLIGRRKPATEIQE